MEKLTQNLIEIRWLRRYEKLDFSRPNTYLVLGQRGSGKSSLLEVIGCYYPKIIDMFGSRDNEGLAWCRSPFRDSILFITGDSVDVKSQWDSKRISQIRSYRDLEKYKVIVSVSAFYGNLDEEYQCLNRLIFEILWYRVGWKQPWFLLIREASNFIYSRIKITKNQNLAKADFVYLLREARHCGCAIGVDTVRWTSIDKEIRDLADYTFIKRVGSIGLPKDLWFIYRYVKPDELMTIPPQFFVCLTNKGAIGAGWFRYPKWHKEERENLLTKLDIKIEYGDIPDYGDPNRNTVSDFEHAQIIQLYIAEGWSMNDISKRLKRSKETVVRHIHMHDEEIASKGECLRCKRAGSKYASSKALGGRSVESSPSAS